MRYRWLNIHLPYACEHSGACCQSGWPIPVEPNHAESIESAVRARSLAPLITPWLTPEGSLATTSGGTCTFYDGRCGVYSSRPQSCVHFPYVCLIDARGVSVTLSHYCPTAASLLFDHEGPIEIVDGPPPIPGREIPEGLDARESLPPKKTERRLMSFDEFSEWESEQVQRFSGSEIQRFDEWGVFAPVVQRYLAAKLFASWEAYQGDGTDAVLQLVDRAEALLRARLFGRDLNAESLKEAIRQTDFALLHRC